MKPAATVTILALLATLAALINHFALTIYFDLQIMLGGSVAVFALLRFGWPGLAVGLAALTVTALRWGHPFELIIGSLFLVWLKAFIDRLNGGREQQDNGRIILAALAFWVVAGIPLEMLLFHFRFGVEMVQALVVALKEATTGMINVIIGFLIYLLTGLAGIRRNATTIPVRGAVFVIVLLAIIIPAISLSLISTHQLQAAIMEAYRLNLRQYAYALVHIEDDALISLPAEGLHYVIEQPDGTARSSDPALTQRLSDHYKKLAINRAGTPGLDLYTPDSAMPVMEGDMKSYWSVTLVHQERDHPEDSLIITVFQPAPVFFGMLNKALLLPVFLVIFGLFVVGALISELLSAMVHRQLNKVLASQGEARLGASSIRELNQLSTEINARDARLDALRDALSQTRQTAYDLTENIPVGTYTMVQPPDGGLAFFSFMSRRFLELTGLEAEEARSDPMKAFACVHPDDRDEWVRKNIEVFEKKIPFREECRVIVKGEIRWIVAESQPRDLADGSVVWEGVLSDITDRKQAEHKLIESESKLRYILDSIPIGIALNELGDESRITLLNDHFTKTFGYTIEDIPYVDTWARLAYPDQNYRQHVFERWDTAVAAAARENGRIGAMEFRMRTKHGHDLNVVISAVVKGQTLLAAFVDVTDLRQTERQLLDLRQRLEKAAYELTENIPVGTYVLEQKNDAPPAFVFCSDRWLGMLDLNRAEVESDPSLPFQRVRSDCRDAFIAASNASIAQGQPFKWEGPIVVRGQTRWVSIESIPRSSGQSRVIWEGVMIDITDRKQAEQELANANRSMRLAAQATNLGFWDLNVETGRDHWDENMCRIHGIRPEEFDGDWKKFVHPDDYDVVMRETERMLASDRIFEMDYRIVRTDGQIRYIREHGLVIRDEQGAALRAHGTMFDITDEVMAAQRERDLEQIHRDNLESKLKSSLAAAAIGHEINTPLSTMLLQSKQSLKRGVADREELTIIIRETEHVLRIIEKMKVLMRNVQTEHFPVNLREVVDSSVLQVNRLLIDHHVEVHVREKATGDGFIVPGDDAQIQLALTNILRNAIEAIAGNDMDRPREILIEITRDDDGIRVAIGDSGPGWSGAELEELPLNTTKEFGTGIGLYIVRTTARNHHARLAFNASLLGGAEVSICFPVA